MTSNQRFGRTIQLFLVDGTPTGLRKTTIHGWTGIVFVCGSAAFAELTKRTEVDRTGIYVLAGPDPEQLGITKVYIGSGNSVAERIKQSALKRDFWETAIAVTTSDDDLSKGHVEYLEARLIELAAEAGRVVLDNGAQPDSNRRRLPEADVANMEQFLSNLRIAFPVVGLEMLKPQPRAVTQVHTPPNDRTVGETKFEISHKSGVNAEAVQEDDEFIVLEGSKALENAGYASNQYANLKSKLLEKGVLLKDGGGMLCFAKPYPFTSPSAAAAVVLDRNSNGRTEWKVKGTKQTYHDWQQTKAARSETME